MEDLSVGLLTSDQLRHKFVANKIAEGLNLKFIITEEKSSKITSSLEYTGKDKEVFDKHFLERQKSELKYFQGNQDFPLGTDVFHMGFGEINSLRTLNILRAYDIEYLLLYGTSIIKDDIINLYPNRVINIHLGLSPFYRGSGTNFWPILNRELECVGGTFHLATKEVDAGDILHQFRPMLTVGDGLHDIGNKVIKSAGKLYPEVIKKFHSRLMKPIKQEKNIGILVKNKDFGPEAIWKAKSNLENGLLQNYLDNKYDLDSKKPIVEQL